MVGASEPVIFNGLAPTGGAGNAGNGRNGSRYRIKNMSNANTAALAGAETGATNAELQSLRESAVPRGVATMLPVFAERALNSEIWDVEGNRYIDFGSGIAVLNTGHMHPRVTGAVREQLDSAGFDVKDNAAPE